MSNQCPKCSLTCPSSQNQCDCGYNFITKDQVVNSKGVFYLWDLKGLLKVLSERDLTPWEEKMYYLLFLAPFIFRSFQNSSGKTYDAKTLVITLVVWAVSLLVAYVYLTALYDANGKNAGKNFLGRYISISAVVNFRFILMMIPFILLIAFQPFSIEGKTSPVTLLAVGAVICLVANSFYRVYASMRELGKNSKLK